MMTQGGMIWKEGDRWYGAIAGDEGVSVLIWSPDRDEVQQNLPDVADLKVGAAARRNLERLRRQLHEYHSGERKKFEIQVNPSGTDFEKKVWNLLSKIPFGKSSTYGEIAEQLGDPKSARAVGNAAGKNPVPLLIPCHRLLASRGKIGGFAMGLEEKKRLLEHEGIDYEE